jgi:hypothetical protein
VLYIEKALSKGGNQMKKKMIFVLITLLLFVFIAPSVYCQETEKPNYKGTGKGEAIIFDLFVLRPLGIISCALGLATTIIGAPLIAGRDNAREIGDALLNEPGNFTVIRPLGQID